MPKRCCGQRILEMAETAAPRVEVNRDPKRRAAPLRVERDRWSTPVRKEGLLDDFAVEVDVETLDLDFFADAEADGGVDHLEDDERDGGAPDERAGNIDQLDADLAEVAVQQPAVRRGVDRVG